MGTIVRTVLQIGKPVGRSAKKLGAAKCMERVAHQQQVVVGPHLYLTIATLALQIGWQAGVWPRKPGAAIMEERGARPLLAVALAPSSGVHSGRVIMETGPPSAGACAIFRCRCLPFEPWAESLQVSG